MDSKSSLLKYFETKGLIKEEDVRKVLVERSRSPKTEEVIIKEFGLVTEDDLAKAKSDIFGIPYIDLRNMEIPEGTIAEVNVDGLQKYRAVPFDRGKDFVKIAMEDPFDVQATQALERKYPQGTRLIVNITTRESINSVLDRRIGEVMSSEVTEALEDVDVPI